MGRKKRVIPQGKVLRHRAIKVPIYPTEKQKTLLAKTFGCCRFFWNQALNDNHEFYSATDKHYIPTPAKYKKDYPFLNEVDSLALANVQLDLKSAFKNFFGNPKHFGVPDFKSKKKSRNSYTTNNQYNGEKPTIYFVHEGVRLPKLGTIRAKIYRTPQKGWKLKSATISNTRSGKYFCSLLYEYIERKPDLVMPHVNNTVGFDYSSPKFYVDDNGFSPVRPRWFRISEDKLAVLQRRLSRMEYDSINYQKQLHRVQLLHEHISNQRQDFAHKESRRITNAYGAACFEGLDLRNMSQTLSLGKSTMDNGFGRFRNFISYKMEEAGKRVIFVDKWHPSSKTCHNCGYVNEELMLKDRFWVCPSCDSLVERDKNAGKNIKQEGLTMFYKERYLSA